MDRLALQVLERLQGEVQEVARAAGGIEHAHGAAGARGTPRRPRAGSSRLASRAVPCSPSARSSSVTLRLHRRELAPQRARAAPARPGRRSRRGRCSGRRAGCAGRGRGRARTACRRWRARSAPSRGATTCVDQSRSRRRQRQHRRRVEQAAVEPLDALGAEHPAARRDILREQLAEAVGEHGRVARVASARRASSPAGSRPASSANRQNSSLSRKWATACGSWPRAAQALGERGELPGRLGGQLVSCRARSQRLGCS